METFNLTVGSSVTSLASLLLADATFSLKYNWSWLYIRNTHATQTILLKTKPSCGVNAKDGAITGTAPGGTEGITIVANGGTFTFGPSDQGFIDGLSIFLKGSGASTTFDIAFARKLGASI